MFQCCGCNQMFATQEGVKNHITRMVRAASAAEPARPWALSRDRSRGPPAVRSGQLPVLGVFACDESQSNVFSQGESWPEGRRIWLCSCHSFTGKRSGCSSGGQCPGSGARVGPGSAARPGTCAASGTGGRPWSSLAGEVASVIDPSLPIPRAWQAVSYLE